MKEEKKQKRVFARLLAYEIKNLKGVNAVRGRGLTCVTTAAPPGGSKDYSNLSWDNDGKEQE